MPTLRLGSQEIGYAVRPSPRGKRLRVRVSPDGVQLILPVGRTEEEGHAFIERHAGWVKSQLAFVARAAGLQRPKASANIWSLPFQGRETAILVRWDGLARGSRIEHRPGSITIHVAPTASVETVSRGLLRWLRRQAREALTARVKVRAREMHVEPGRMFVMGQRTKWGNCSRRRNFSFNWRMVLAPPDVLDYLVVHELAHLLVPAHTAEFWLIVRSFCPRFESHRQWLKEHARRLRSAGTN
jgi:predicted metal-dependent hydrolase